MSAHAGDGISARIGRLQHSFLWSTLCVLTFLIFAHAAIAASLLAIFGTLVAMVYVIFPPIATITAYEAINDAPLFALFCLALTIGTTAMFWPLARTVLRASPFYFRVFALLIFAIWIPTLSAEGLRWTLIQNEIVRAKPQCHGAITLMASLRERDDFGDFDHGVQPHAWMLKDGTIWLWSYRRLRFEPAPEWRGGIADCKTAVQATDSAIGQQW